MRLSIATTWDDTLLEKLEECNTKYKTIYEIFGALDSSIIGTGRTRTTVPKVTKERVKEHVDFAHSLGIEVDYLLSASCMGGIEYTTKRRRALEQYLDWINSLNIDTVTVSIPYLIELIKNQYPAIKVNVSTIAHVKSVQQAIFFDRLGVDRITVSYMINRYLNLLEAMNKSTKCELEILVNESCMHDCPYRDYHYNLTSHGSQEIEQLEEIPQIDRYCFLKCTIEKLEHPEQILKARWIRPEDIYKYEEVGIDIFKIAGREKTTKYLVDTALAYSKRKCGENLIDILAIIPPDIKIYQDLLGEECSNVRPPEIIIHNNFLNKFLDSISKVNCTKECGLSCKYCDSLIEKGVIEIRESKEYLDALKDAHKKMFKRVEQVYKM